MQGQQMMVKSYRPPATQASGVKNLTDESLDAAFSPLEDLGLRAKEAPELLKQWRENPYDLSQAKDCPAIQKEIALLDGLLGADMDQPKQALTLQDKAVEEGTGMIHDAVVGFVRAQVDIIPLRSVVRRLTGAKRKEREFSEAVQAGKLRRAYLRGVADTRFGSQCISGKRVIVGDSMTP